MAATPSGRGYWLVASDGGIFTFGDAAFYGSTGAMTLNKPIVGMASTPTGRGYWLVASDGGVFTFGDARFFGSTGGPPAGQPIVGMAATPTGAGYWMVASDGGVFTFGDAGFFGSGPERAAPPGAPRAVVALVPSASGKGYWQASATGELLAFGDAADLGRPSGLNRPLVGLAAPVRRTTGGSGGGAAGPGSTTNPITPMGVPGGGPERFSTSANVTWGTSPGEPDKAGRVLAMVERGGVVYLGGEFTGFVPPSGGPVTPRSFLAAIDAATGKLLPWNPTADGSVRALAVSADGRRLYVGGDFNAIGGGAAAQPGRPRSGHGRPRPVVRPAPGQLRGPDHGPRRQPPLRRRQLHRHHRARRPARRRAITADPRWPPSMPPAEPWCGTGSRRPTPAVATSDTRASPSKTATTASSTTSPSPPTAAPCTWPATSSTSGAGPGSSASTRRTAGPPPGRRRPTGPSSPWPSHPPTAARSTRPRAGRAGACGGSTRAGRPRRVWEVKTDGDNVDVVATGSMVYLIGHYDNIVPKSSSCYQACPEGTGRRHLSAFAAATGKLDAWDPEANTPQGPYVATDRRPPPLRGWRLHQGEPQDPTRFRPVRRQVTVGVPPWTPTGVLRWGG